MRFFMMYQCFIVHKNIVGFFVAAGLFLFVPTGFTQELGKEIFTQKCSACHSIGKGRLVGPDLAGVNDRRSEGWLLKFIKSPQAVINSGDPG
ncbi:MAG TPA: hypothetical protein DEP87_02810, partial [Candidatus Pacebacteria bacterium]|nr:hypothetical protein [Candidatus Paceibacterota bacterium]